MADITRSRSIAASPDQIWSVLADFAAIAAWASNVDHSSILEPGPEGGGLGTTRRIQTGRRTLVERVITWEPSVALAYDIEGLPPKIRSVRNRWDLTAETSSSTVVRLTSSVDAGPRPPQLLVARILCRVLARQSDVMLGGLADHLVTGARRG